MMTSPLRATEILANIPAQQRHFVSGLHIAEKIDSTNTYVLQQAQQGGKSGLVCLAEEQTAGRGRFGRTWLSPPASNIYLSLLWYFPHEKDLAGLSLAVGIAIIRALKRSDIKNEIGLKWPNDVYYAGRKLAGILIETEKQHDILHTVIGIGLNVQMPSENNSAWIDLCEITGKNFDRSKMAGLLLSELFTILTLFTQHDLQPFLEEWNAFDLSYQQPVTIIVGGKEIKGIAQGINTHGELLLLCEDGTHRNFASAEVSLRL